MPKAYAFFDVDGTLVHCHTLSSFEAFYVGATEGPTAVEQARWLFGNLACLPRNEANRRYFARYAGRSVARVEAEIENWYRGLGDVFMPRTVEALRHLRRRGVEPVFVSGSSVSILRPFARELGVEDVLATRLETGGDVYTGRILPPQTIGDGKREVAARFLEQKGADPSQCYAFGDHESDLPLLEWVGNPGLVTEDPHLCALACERSWNLLPPTKGKS